jgi:hypothetical protein
MGQSLDLLVPRLGSRCTVATQGADEEKRVKTQEGSEKNAAGHGQPPVGVNACTEHTLAGCSLAGMSQQGEGAKQAAPVYEQGARDKSSRARAGDQDQRGSRLFAPMHTV